ncbi:MAG: extensin family protein [Mesorhizobium sp.]|nr:extensin family protein [Mesorhizobium sp.]
MLVLPALCAASAPAWSAEPISRADLVKPQPRPAQPGDAERVEPEAAIDPEDVPKPEPRPENPKPRDTDTAAPAALEKDAPPSGDAGPAPGTEPPKVEEKPAAPDLMPPPRPAEMPADEKACRMRLTALGVRFEERSQLADKAGCSVPWPIAVSTLSATIPLEPDAVLNCATAEAMAKFTAETIAPAARVILNATIEKVRHDSAYVCRARNGTKKLSEHAFGNAIDFGAFALSDKRVVTVGSAASRAEGEFLLALRLAACGPFTTVLGPGSDADHASHFHFDLAKRRPGSAFCQ